MPLPSNGFDSWNTECDIGLNAYRKTYLGIGHWPTSSKNLIESSSLSFPPMRNCNASWLPFSTFAYTVPKHLDKCEKQMLKSPPKKRKMRFALTIRWCVHSPYTNPFQCGINFCWMTGRGGTYLARCTPSRIVPVLFHCTQWICSHPGKCALLSEWSASMIVPIEPLIAAVNGYK